MHALVPLSLLIALTVLNVIRNYTVTHAVDFPTVPDFTFSTGGSRPSSYTSS
jgi:hypothetical protein